MRPIKFRGKRLDDGEWVYGDLIHGQGSKYGKTYILPQCPIYPKGCSELDGWNVDPETVGQLIIPADYEHNHTGFDFYEGDIVDEFEVLRELKFEICDDTQGFDVNLDFWQCKVIGNKADYATCLMKQSNYHQPYHEGEQTNLQGKSKHAYHLNEELSSTGECFPKTGAALSQLDLSKFPDGTQIVQVGSQLILDIPDSFFEVHKDLHLDKRLSKTCTDYLSDEHYKEQLTYLNGRSPKHCK